MTRVVQVAMAALLAGISVIVLAGLLLPDTFELQTELQSKKSSAEVFACVSKVESWAVILAESDDDRFEVDKDSQSKATWYSAGIGQELPVELTTSAEAQQVELRYEGAAGPTIMRVTVEAAGGGTTIKRELLMEASNAILGPIAYRLYVEPYRKELETNGDERLRRACQL